MKILILVSAIILGSSAIELCTLSLFDKRDYWDWRYAATGFMAGLHNVPPQDSSSCKECVDFGIAVGSV